MSLVSQISSAVTALATKFNVVTGDIGDKTALTTTDKSSLVAAINEVKAGSAGSPADASDTVKGIVELATLAEVATGTDTTRAVTAAGVRQERAALKTEILGAGVPGALDTLDELAAALGDDANYAASTVTSLSNKQPLDADLTAIAALTSAANKGLQSTGTGTWALYDLTAAGKALLDDADAAAQRTTLSVYSQTEVGDPTTDFVATFNAGLS
jgi:hypothetical protein